jgi:DNA polymerase-4
VFVPPDFELYRDRSRDVMAVLREHVELVEQVGLDEAYLDLSGLESPRAAARRVKAAIGERTGLSCSIGVGPSKLVAKVASDADKPDGFVVLGREEACTRFAGLSPGLIPGIGPKSVERLRALGISTLGELRLAGEERLMSAFGPRQGRWLHRVAHFVDERTIETVRVAKSESRETTFDHDLRGPAELEPVLVRLAGDLCKRLGDQERSGRTVGIKIRLDDFSTHTRARTLDAPTNDEATVRTVALELLRAFDAQRPVRLLGVRVAGLDEAEGPAPQAAPAPGQLELTL